MLRNQTENHFRQTLNTAENTHNKVLNKIHIARSEQYLSAVLT